jgi:hypothetical protein
MAKTNKRKQQYENIESEKQKTGAEYGNFMNQFLGRESGTTAAYDPTYNNTGGSKGSKSGAGGGKGFAGSIFGKNQAEQEPEANHNLESPIYKQLQEAGASERGYLNKGFQGFAENGGMDPDTINQMRSAYGNIGGPAAVNLQDFAKEKAGYGDLADTGGYSGQDIQRVRAQAARSAPSLYGALRDQQNLNQTKMGGANAGAGAIDFKSARQAAQQSANDRLGANIGLSESIRSGKLSGLGGLTGIDTTMGDQSLAKAGQENQFNIGKAGIGSNVEGQIANMQQQGKQFGLSGLQGLYGQDYAPQRGFENQWLNAIGAQSGANQGATGLSLQNDEVNRSKAMENIIGITGAVAGGMTGMGGIMNAVGGLAGKAAGGGAPASQMGQSINTRSMGNAFGGQNFSGGGYNANIGFQPGQFTGQMPGANPYQNLFAPRR